MEVRLWLHSLKVAQLLRSAACLHTNQSRSYLNHLVIICSSVANKWFFSFLDIFKCNMFTAASALLHQISLKANHILLSTVSFRIVIPVTSEALLYIINPPLGTWQRPLKV